MKIIITGLTGFLGWGLFNFLKTRHQVLGTFFSHEPETDNGSSVFLDIRDNNAVRRLVRNFRPEFIIHTAAVTSPAECLKNPELARQVNVEGTEQIARAAEGRCRLIYTSTDRVFDGQRGNYREEDLPHPPGIYGQTKLEGEKRLEEISPDFLIIRLPLMYGPPSPFHGPFTSWMLEAFMSKKPLSLFTDQFRSPLYLGDALKAIDRILEHPQLSGLYHIGGSERINRADFGYRMAEIFGCDPSLIRPVKMTDLPHLPPSPADASLNSDKFFQATGFRARNATDGLRKLKEDLLRNK